MKKKHIGFFHIMLCFLLTCTMILSCGCQKKVPEEAPAEEPQVVTQQPESGSPELPAGYRSAEAFQDGFIACGTDGRLDFISMDGEVRSCDSGTTEDLLCVYVDGDEIWVSGTGGTLLSSKDGGNSFWAIDVGVKDSLCGIAMYEGERFVAGERGLVYRETPTGWEPVQLGTDCDLIGLASTQNCLTAITAQTDICITMDGRSWESYRFNEVYEGLYPAYVFTRTVSAGETVFVLGYIEESPNQPLIMYSELGDVWMQRAMLEINSEPISEDMDLRIHDISFNVDQIVGVLNDGRVLAITDCVTCNEMKTLEGAKGLWATAAQEAGVLLCGEDFYCSVMKSSQIRQDKIGAEQAKTDLEYGAVLIDVREQDELDAEGYIPGSLHIPLSEVESRLPEEVPDLYTEVIFYCASGKRSQTATELAVEMGYVSVYNLGGLSDWPYEIVKREPSGGEG